MDDMLKRDLTTYRDCAKLGVMNKQGWAPDADEVAAMNLFMNERDTADWFTSLVVLAVMLSPWVGVGLIVSVFLGASPVLVLLLGVLIFTLLITSIWYDLERSKP